MKRIACTCCGRELPETAQFFNRDAHKKNGLDSQCKRCRRDYHKAYVRKPEVRAKRNARHAERMRNDPEYAERVRKQNRENRRRQRKENPEVQRKQVRRQYDMKRNDPERWAEFLAKKREYMKRVRAEQPEKYEALLEARRIMRRLRRIEQGLPVRKAKLVAPSSSAETIPTEPLRRFFEATGLSNEDLARRMHIDEARVRRVMAAEVCTLDWVDRACIAMNVHIELLYDDDTFKQQQEGAHVQVG